ncbi:MAG: hypothetical protein A4S09_06560 [Proteobacteria bacterium SG_bin7]|nr:MAG: hypothetical protein A4S09_06560 [Proteobacteria bacterium SG_bin7]
MNSKLLDFSNLETEIESHGKSREEVVSLDTQDQPTEDFRVLVSNLQTIEEVMTAKAKTVRQKAHLLFTWEKLRGLLMAMIVRLEKDIERARKMEQMLAETKEKAHMLNVSGYFN